MNYSYLILPISYLARVFFPKFEMTTTVNFLFYRSTGSSPEPALAQAGARMTASNAVTFSF